MITYNDIYEAIRKEKYSETLQQLPKNFILEVSEYIKEKKELASKEDDLFSDAILKTKKQVENAISIFRELILRRKKKLLNLAFVARETGISKRDFENMFEFEKVMFDKIIQSMEDSDKALADVMNGHTEPETIKNQLIMFRENTEEFMGTDGEMLGPFTQGDLANLPREVTKILIDAGKVELVESG